MVNGYRRLGRTPNALPFSKNVSLFGILVILAAFIALFYLYLNAKSELEGAKSERNGQSEYITRLKNELLEKNAKIEGIRTTEEDCKASRITLNNTHQDCLKDLKSRALLLENNKETFENLQTELNMLRKLKDVHVAKIEALNVTISRMKSELASHNEIVINQEAVDNPTSKNSTSILPAAISKIEGEPSRTNVTTLHEKNTPIPSNDKIVKTIGIVRNIKPAISADGTNHSVAVVHGVESTDAAVTPRKEVSEIRDVEDFENVRKPGGRLGLGEKDTHGKDDSPLLNAAAAVEGDMDAVGGEANENDVKSVTIIQDENNG